VSCEHRERVDGVCVACGDCAHDVVLNGACLACGATAAELEERAKAKAKAKAPPLIAAERLARSRRR
jgi:hypothetical protein